MLRTFAAASLVVAAITSPAEAAPPEPSPAPTPAESRAHAKRLFEQGQAHYDLGEYDEAIAAFREAYEISSAPALLFNIAQAHRLKGDCPRALQVYRHFVRLDPDSPHRPSAEEHIATLSSRCEPKTPAATSSASAGEPTVRTTSEESDAARSAGTERSTNAPPPASRESATTQPYVVLGLVSGGLALAGVAAGLHFWNNSRFDTWQNEDRMISASAGASPDAVRARSSANNELLGGIRRTDTLSMVLAIAGGAAIVAGGTLFFTWQPQTPSNHAGALSLSWTTSW